MSLVRTSITLLATVWVSVAAGVTGASGQDSPVGRVRCLVTVADSKGQPLALPGATVTLTCAPDKPATGVSDEQGAFVFTGVRPGGCDIEARLPSFRPATKAISVAPSVPTDVVLRLEVAPLNETVTVTGSADRKVDESAAHVDRLSGDTIQDAPIAGARFQDALPLVPGVVRAPDGLLSVEGARSNQTNLTVNSAGGSDPVTGESAIELPLDAISAVEVRGTAYAPEFGDSVGAVTSVETQRGGDAWHVQANDLEPRVRRRGGKFVGIESFTPQVTVGGPLARGRVHLLQSAQIQFTRTQVFGLPPFESDTQFASLMSFSRIDWTVNGMHHLTGSGVIAPSKTTYAGLSTLNPQRATPNIRNHNWLGSVADQVVLPHGASFEARVSVKQFDTAIHPSDPGGAMIVAPEGNDGSYFNDQVRASRRLEWTNAYSFAPSGTAHLVKLLGGLTQESYSGTSRSRPVEIVRPDGSVLERIAFVGDGDLRSQRTTIWAAAQDAWTASPRLNALYGARLERDSLTGDTSLAPRVSWTALLTPDGRTLLRGGVGVFYKSIPLNVASFDQLQARRVTTFDVDGTETATTLYANIFASAPRTSRSFNWIAEVDRELVHNLFVRIAYQYRDTRFEPLVDPQSVFGAPVLALRTDGTSRYREVQATGRYRFHAADQIVVSYTRSSAVGDLNDVNAYLGNVENPIIRPNESGPLPWDAPDRWLSWANLTLPRGFGVFPVLDVRTGFPLSVTDAERNFIGGRDRAGRFPTFVSFDTAITKRLQLFHHRATIGLKIFNLTNHFNPRDFQGNLDSVRFGGFSNGVGRTFRAKWVFEF